MSLMIFNNFSNSHKKITFDMLLSYFYHILFYSVFLLFFMLDIVSLDYHLFSEVHPSFLIATIFYISLFIPKLLPIWAVFSVGIIYDLIVGLPFGISAILFIGMSITVKSQRKFLLGQNFNVIWLSFGTISLIFFTLEWWAISIFNWYLFNFLPSIVNAVLTALIFPFIVVLFHKLKYLLKFKP